MMQQKTQCCIWTQSIRASTKFLPRKTNQNQNKQTRLDCMIQRYILQWKTQSIITSRKFLRCKYDQNEMNEFELNYICQNRQCRNRKHKASKFKTLELQSSYRWSNGNKQIKFNNIIDSQCKVIIRKKANH